MSRAAVAVLLLLAGLLLIGTFQLDLLTATRFKVDLPISGTNQLQTRLHELVRLTRRRAKKESAFRAPS